MTTDACADVVKNAFRNTPGTTEVMIDRTKATAAIRHDAEKMSPEQIVLLVQDRGFDVEIVQHLVTTTLSVKGMTCGACTSAVQGAFADVKGVRSVSVSLLAERAVIEHEEMSISAEEIGEFIEERGFEAQVISTDRPTSMLTTTIGIEGMTCGACTSAVQAAFDAVEGLLSINISLLAERAIVTHDSAILPCARIIELVEEKGFDAHVVESRPFEEPAGKGMQQNQLKIFGLHDATTATKLEESLRTLSGIGAAQVNLSASRLCVHHDSQIIGLRSIVRHVEAAGCNALVAENDDNNAQLESLAKTREISDWRKAFLFSLSFAIPVFCISMLIPMTLPRLDFSAVLLFIPGLYLGDVLCLALTIPVQFGIGRRFYRSAYKSLMHGAPTMDVLVVLGTSAAFFFSVAAMGVSVLIPPHSRPQTVFETSTMLLTFITLGRYLENRAKGQTSKALSRLMCLTPSTASIFVDPIAAAKKTKVNADAMAETTIPSELIEVGDIVILRPGGHVPADGVVVHGKSYFDESMVTGEAAAIYKQPGSPLMAGTVNGAARVEFRVTKAGRDTQLSQIVKLVQDAQTSRAPIQRMADIVAGYFVPTIMALGFITFIVWMILSHVLPEDRTPDVFRHSASGGKFMVCLKMCISVIVFACPCALGLSTPTAVMVGTGIGAEQGILVKGGAALETATKIKHIVFDKTGTLTMGKMSIASYALDVSPVLFWNLLGVAESSSEHPIGKAISSYARLSLSLADEASFNGLLAHFDPVVGKGILAKIEFQTRSYTVLVGSDRYLEAEGVSLPSTKTRITGSTIVFVAIDGQYAGHLVLLDMIKPTTKATIIALSRSNVAMSLVTGDAQATAMDVATAVGIPRTNVYAGVSPEQKQQIIKQIQAGGDVVAMIGDGINDSPALATADVGIALSSGTDVAMEAADIVLMRPDDLLSVVAALDLSHTIFNRIKLNLVWACLYNLIGLPFAMGVGLLLPGHVMLPPMAAGAAMALSSVSVVGSSLLLKLWKRPGWMTVEKLESLGLQNLELTDMSIGRASSKLPAVFGNPLRLVSRQIRRARGQEASYVPLQEFEPV